MSLVSDFSYYNLLAPVGENARSSNQQQRRRPTGKSSRSKPQSRSTAKNSPVGSRASANQSRRNSSDLSAGSGDEMEISKSDEQAALNVMEELEKAGNISTHVSKSGDMSTHALKPQARSSKSQSGLAQVRIEMAAIQKQLSILGQQVAESVSCGSKQLDFSRGQSSPPLDNDGKPSDLPSKRKDIGEFCGM